MLLKKDDSTRLSSKSERTHLDARAPMGVATHNVIGRLAASVGALVQSRHNFEQHSMFLMVAYCAHCQPSWQ